jgi:tetratricopeptide (TPR) repeat protein
MAAYYAALSIGPFRTDSSGMLLARAERLAQQAPDRDRLLIKQARYGLNYPVRAAVAESLSLRYPNEPDGPLAMASVRVHAGDFAGALPYARRVIAMDSLSLELKTPLCRACEAFRVLLSAYAAMGSDSFPAVERTANEWIRRQPKSSSAWLMLAKAQASRGRGDRALQALNNATQLEPAHACFTTPSTMPTVLFASAVIQGENYAIAERLLRDRSRFDERDQEAIWWLVTSLRHQGRIKESLSLVEQAKRFRVAEGRTLDVWEYVEATLLFELGRRRESARTFEALMRAKPNDPSDPGYASRYGCKRQRHGRQPAQRLPAHDSIERAAR